VFRGHITSRKDEPIEYHRESGGSGRVERLELQERRRETYTRY
jgi:hypothetical protein